VGTFIGDATLKVLSPLLKFVAREFADFIEALTLVLVLRKVFNARIDFERGRVLKFDLRILAGRLNFRIVKAAS
jgi:hypothetical protein